MTKMGQTRKKNLVESEVSRYQMTNGNEIRRERDLLRPSGESKCIAKWQKAKFK